MATTRKDPAAVSLGRRGGKARVRNMTPEERSEAARKAVKARWAKGDTPQPRMGLTDKEIAGSLGVSLERLRAAFNEAGLRLKIEKTEPGKARNAKAEARRKVSAG